MDAKILVAVFGVFLVATISCQSTPEQPVADDPNFVPGVFIPADALKSLQEKAKLPEKITEDSRTDPPKVSKKSDQVTDINLPESNQGSFQPNPQIPEQQLVNQPMGNQNYPNQQVYSNPPMQNQQIYNNPQPVQFPNQQNQQFPYQQPIYQQPGYQQNGMNPQPYMSNQQPILIAQQPSYQNPQIQQGVPNNQQPSYQQPILVSQPNQQLFIPNGQMTQPNMAGNPNMMSGAVLANPGAGQQSNIYAMVPINSQTLPGQNLNNNNAYFVPVQQLPSNAVLLNNGK